MELKKAFPFWFILCLAIFIAHQVAQKTLHISIPFADNYLDVFLFPLILIHLFTIEQVFLKKNKSYKPDLTTVIAITLFACLVSEIVFPLLSKKFFYDPYDFIAIATGMLFYLLVGYKKSPV